MELTNEQKTAEQEMDAFISALFQSLDNSNLILTTYPGHEGQFLLTHSSGVQKAFSFNKWNELVFTKESDTKQ